MGVFAPQDSRAALLGQSPLGHTPPWSPASTHETSPIYGPARLVLMVTFISLRLKATFIQADVVYNEQQPVKGGYNCFKHMLKVSSPFFPFSSLLALATPPLTLLAGEKQLISVIKCHKCHGWFFKVKVYFYNLNKHYFLSRTWIGTFCRLYHWRVSVQD